MLCLHRKRLMFGAVAALCLAVVAKAGGPPYGIPSGVLSSGWARYGTQEYQQLYHGYRVAHPNPSAVAAAPSAYSLHITHPKVKHEADDPNVAVLMAHVPVDAAIFFGDYQTRQTGKERWFETAALLPGQEVEYSVRVVWHEGDKWVSETRQIPVRAGAVICIDLRPAGARTAPAEVAANLAKLSREDRELAESQKFCAIQNNNRLGEMGVPAKVMVNGQPVFLCCSGCEKTAVSNPERTLAKVAELRTAKR